MKLDSDKAASGEEIEPKDQVAYFFMDFTELNKE